VHIGATGVYAVLMKPGLFEFLILAFVIVLLFGSTRLPAFGRYLGRGMREFKDELLGKDEPEELAAAPDDAAGADLDLVEPRAVEHEHALDTDVEAHLAHGEGASKPRAVLLDDDALEDLDAVLVALDDLVVDANGVADPKIRMIRPELTGFEGKIAWNSSKPDGQPRRKLNVERAWKEFQFRSSTPFREGLGETIRWYQQVMAGSRSG